MTRQVIRNPTQTVVIVGGGLSGLLCAIQVRKLCPQASVLVIERSLRRGPGLAYGVFAAGHVLNVPARRLQTGSEPAFSDWLASHVGDYDLGEALAEAGGRIDDVFAPRAAFGDFLEETAQRSVERGVFDLDPGRSGRVPASATPGRRPVGRNRTGSRRRHSCNRQRSSGPGRHRRPGDVRYLSRQPLGPGALERVAPSDAVVLIGTGLTAVDVMLALQRNGHVGSVAAVSRRGLMPRRHRLCPPATPFVSPDAPGSPSHLMNRVRKELARATAAGEPWQGVIDALRPITRTIWQTWTDAEKRSFLRHLRSWWDVHRHRMAPRVADRVEHLHQSDRAQVVAGRIVSAHAEGDAIVLDILPRHTGATLQLKARHVINCTGPTTDVNLLASPIVDDGLARGFIRRDALGLGIETSACAAIAADGQASDWLFAIGPLTRPEFWETTAVPEILGQGRALAERLSAADATRGYGI